MQEEGHLVVMRLVNHVDGFVADGIGVIETIGIIGDEFSVFHQGVRMEETAGARKRAVEAIKATLRWRRVARGARSPAFRIAGGQETADMPLARHHGPVAGALQRLSDGHGVIAQITLIGACAPVIHHVADAGLMRVQARQQRRPRGAAARETIHLREARAACRQSVEIGRCDLGAEAADIGVAPSRQRESR